MALNVWRQVEELLGCYDSTIKIDCMSECAWAGEMRLTLTNPEGAPSRSMTFYSVGKAGPEQVARALLADVGVWLRESGVVPMPVPGYARAPQL